MQSSYILVLYWRPAAYGSQFDMTAGASGLGTPGHTTSLQTSSAFGFRVMRYKANPVLISFLASAHPSYCGVNSHPSQVACSVYLSPQVEGYAVGCECSPCGDLLVTGSADGRVLMFSFRTARRACTLQGHMQACLGTTYHPVLPSVLGTCSWGGDIKIWH